MADDPKEIERDAVEKLRRLANDPTVRHYGTARFAHKELVALDALIARLDKEHRQWARDNVQRRARTDEPTCEHAPGYMEYSTCVVCAWHLGRSEGHGEAGAYTTHEELRAELEAQFGTASPIAGGET